MSKVGVGLLGSQFITAIHYEALRTAPDAEVLAVASPTEQHVRQFAEKRGIPRWFTDYHQLLNLSEIDLVVLGIPNDLHCQAVLDAAAAGKHVVLEKPMAMTLAECDRMIDACRHAGVKLMYAEELCFAPKYVRLKQLVDSGALGRVHLVKQSEKHDGPHSDWFYNEQRSGGGVALDMGCHAVQFFRWLLSGKGGDNPPRAKSVYAHLTSSVHSQRTTADDDALIIVEFEGGITGLAEESWSKPGGMDDRAEVFGGEGQAYADLLRGNSIHTYSKQGYDYAVEKSGGTKGWSFTMYEENWNYGFPQEMAHFVECVRDDKAPLVSGEDGRATLEIILAAYASAGQGRKIELPWANGTARPIELWRGK